MRVRRRIESERYHKWVLWENIGINQGCVNSPWLFSIFMDGVLREVEARSGVDRNFVVLYRI